MYPLITSRKPIRDDRRSDLATVLHFHINALKWNCILRRQRSSARDHSYSYGFTIPRDICATPSIIRKINDQCNTSLRHTYDYSTSFPSLPFRIFITLKRNTSHETRYTLLTRDPEPHKVRQILRPTISLSNELHRTSCRLERKRRAEVVYRRCAYFAVRAER